MLEGQGFKEIYNLSGGIRAWNGAVAEGPVELNLDMIRGDETPVELITLAYGMEQCLGDFYRTVKDKTKDVQVSSLLDLLASMEEKHKEHLVNQCRALKPADWNQEQFEAEVTTTVMEGGLKAEDFVAENAKFLQTVPDTLDVSMMLEAQALDLYLRFAEKAGNEDTKRVLYKIGDEEKHHLESLGRLRDEKIA